MQDNIVTALRCTISRIIFSRDNFSICECVTRSEIPAGAIRDIHTAHGDQVFTALGYGLPKCHNKQVLLSGTWERNTKYRCLQLRVEDCEDYVGKSKNEIVAYLSSNILKGIGIKTAERLYAAFGENVIHIIENDPEQLLSVPGIKEKKLEQIVTSFADHRDFHHLTMLLSKYGVNYRSIVRIQRGLGKRASRLVKENPYILCNVSGFGFKTADSLAREMGHPADSQFRIAGAIMYVLDRAQLAGHMFMLKTHLVSDCCSSDVLNTHDCEVSISPEQVNEVIDLMLENKALGTPSLPGEDALLRNPPIYKARALFYEQFAAECIAAKLRTPCSADPDWEAVVARTTEALAVTLDARQAEAAIVALRSPLSIITGGPGTGKTTSLNVIVQAYSFVYPDKKISQAAPTGRAARRMTEQTGRSANTLHSLLGLTPDSWTDFSKEPSCGELIDASLLIVDESSMIDGHMLAELMYRVRPETQVVFLGDADQLPSVGAGNVLSQLLNTDIVPSVRLTKIFRQSEDSLVPVNAAQIRKGINALQFNNNFGIIECKNEAEGAERIRQLVELALKRGTFSSFQILCPMKKRGDTCTSNLNALLGEIVNPPAADKSEALVAGILFREGDKVMQTRNIEGVSNGDIGYVLNILGDPKNPEAFRMFVQFESYPSPVEYDYEGALDLVHAIAITIHKSQGSEFDAVIVPIFSSMSFFLRRNLLYTAVTRAKKKVLLFSDGPGISTAIRREDTSKRNTLLSRLIHASCAHSSLKQMKGDLY